MSTRTRRTLRRLWANLATIALLVSVGTSAYFYNSTHELAVQNRHRTIEIQRSRLVSCERSYEAFNEVFKPFFPPPGKRTDLQQKNLDKLHRTIDGLKARCDSQVATDTRP